VTFFSLLL